MPSEHEINYAMCGVNKKKQKKLKLPNRVWHLTTILKDSKVRESAQLFFDFLVQFNTIC